MPPVEMLKNKNPERRFMQEALKQAYKGFKLGEVPVGAVIIHKGKIISRGYNTRTRKKDPLGHAEIMAINRAAKKINDFRLNDCEIYVTVEPCILCLGAIIQSRIKRLVYGCKNASEGALGIYPTLKRNIKTGYKLNITRGVLNDQSTELMRNFFSKLRNH